ncbi:hypothetical protein CDAR_101341, partial [Caerostris darwini]
TMKR